MCVNFFNGIHFLITINSLARLVNVLIRQLLKIINRNAGIHHTRDLKLGSVHTLATTVNVNHCRLGAISMHQPYVSQFS